MADVGVKIKVQSDVENDMGNFRSRIDNEFGKTKSAIKKHSDDSSKYVKKMTNQVEDLALKFVGLAAATKSLQYLSVAIKNAGLDTTRFDTAAGQISATIGNELLPDMQNLYDAVTNNSKKISQFAVIAIRAIKAPFDAATIGILGAGDVVLRILARIDKKNRETHIATANALRQEAIAIGDKLFSRDNWNPDAVAIKNPVTKKQIANSAQRSADMGFGEYGPEQKTFENDKLLANIKTYSSAMDQVRQKQHDAEAVFRDASISQITNQNEREIAEHEYKFEQLRTLYSGNETALTSIKLAQEIERTSIDDEQSKRRIQIAEQEKRMKQAAAMEVATQFAETLVLIGQAARADAQTQKGLATVQAVINTAVAASKANSATPYPPVNAALMTLAIAQGMAQVAIIQGQKFAAGGIVGGNSYTGDRVPAMLNSREMVLTMQDQASLLKQIRDGGGASSGMTLQFYDHSGRLSESIRAEVRSGKSQYLLDELTKEIRRRM